MRNAHTIDDLKQMQSLPLEAKIRMTKERIQGWYDAWSRYEIENTKTGRIHYITATEEPTHQNGMLKENEEITTYGWQPGAVYLSFSGGKDSTVLKHIIDSMGLDIPAVFVNTGLEYPELQLFVRDIKNGKHKCFNPNVEILTPRMRFDEVVKNVGYPIIGKKQADELEGARRGIELGNYNFRLYNIGVTPDEAASMGLRIPPDDMLERYKKTSIGSMFRHDGMKKYLDAPFKISARCCDIMKKEPAFDYQRRTGRKPLLATMAWESQMRRNAWLKNGCNAFNGAHETSQPMAFWTEQDVLSYIVKYSVPYAPVYGDIVPDHDQIDGQMNMMDIGVYDVEQKLKTTGCDRTGCMFCMFGVAHDGAPNRFQRMKETHPKQYAYCMKPVDQGGLGIKEVMEYIGVDYE